MKNTIAIVLFLAAFTIGCKSSQQTTTTQERDSRVENRTTQERGGRNRGERPQGRPTVDEIFKMDANKDGKLSKSEVKGPLERDFARIDSNGDGFITKAELENAPRPQRRQGSRQNNN